MSAKKKVLKVIMVTLAVFVGLVTVAFAAYYVYEHRTELPIIKNAFENEAESEGNDVNVGIPVGYSAGGFTAQGDGVKTGSTESLIKWTWKYTVTAYTCDNDLYNAEWTGDWIWNWESIGEDGNVGTDDGDGTMTFTTEDGKAEYLMGDTPVTVEMDSDSFVMQIDFQPLGVMNLAGTIVKGSDMCGE